MNSACTISVIIPTYNREKTIEYCLRSVLNQTYSPYEVIVVDDCSTDQTLSVINRIADPRLKIHQLKKNAGAQAARNTGIKAATGEWIAFQDSDDAWLPHKLERQISTLKETAFNPYTVIHSNCYKFYPSTNQQEVWNLPVTEGSHVYPLLLQRPSPMFQGMLVSKQALEKINLLDEKIQTYQEWDTAIRLAKVCAFIHIQAPLFIYYLHESDAISKNVQKDITGYQYILQKHGQNIANECGNDALIKQLNFNVSRAMNAGLWKIAARIIRENQSLILSSTKGKVLSGLAALKIKPNQLAWVSRLFKVT